MEGDRGQDGEREEEIKGEGKATEEGNGKSNGNVKGTDIVKQKFGGDEITHAITLQLQKEMYDPDSDMEG